MEGDIKLIELKQEMMTFLTEALFLRLTFC